jgi:hypothetical protein
MSYDQDTRERRFASRPQQKQASTALMTAIEMYRAMDMGFWRAQTEAVLAQAAA